MADHDVLKWTNRERIMILCSRGCSYRDRHLMQDFRNIMPHSKSDSKIDKNNIMQELTEMCEMRNCSKCLHFENRKKKDLYLWLACIPRGPSVKFLVHNVHTMMELKLTGNCLKGSRPILSFDSTFDSKPHFVLLKEMLIQTFSTPCRHPRSQPFVDHVLNFSIEDDRIWFRNYQIVNINSCQLEEIGPRMVLELVKIFDNCFGGAVLYENASYVSPNQIRRVAKQLSAGKYERHVQAKKTFDERRKLHTRTYATDVTDDIFDTLPSTAQSNQILGKRKKLRSKARKRKKQKGQSFTGTSDD